MTKEDRDRDRKFSVAAKRKSYVILLGVQKVAREKSCREKFRLQISRANCPLLLDK
jgi:hypothetical protein